MHDSPTVATTAPHRAAYARMPGPPPNPDPMPKPRPPRPRPGPRRASPLRGRAPWVAAGVLWWAGWWVGAMSLGLALGLLVLGVAVAADLATRPRLPRAGR
jgi:hypothetical protein